MSEIELWVYDVPLEGGGGELELFAFKIGDKFITYDKNYQEVPVTQCRKPKKIIKINTEKTKTEVLEKIDQVAEQKGMTHINFSDSIYKFLETVEKPAIAAMIAAAKAGALKLAAGIFIGYVVIASSASSSRMSGC